MQLTQDRLTAKEGRCRINNVCNGHMCRVLQIPQEKASIEFLQIVDAYAEIKMMMDDDMKMMRPQEGNDVKLEELSGERICKAHIFIMETVRRNCNLRERPACWN